MYNKIIFFVDIMKAKKKAFEVKSKFLQFIKTTSNFTHYVQNSRRSASKYIIYKTLAAVQLPCCLLKEKNDGRKSKNLCNWCVRKITDVCE